MLGDGGGPRPDGLRPPREDELLLVLAGGGGRFPAGAGRGGEPLLLVAAGPGFFIFGGGAVLLLSSESATHSPGEPPEDEKSTRTLCPERFTTFPVFPAIFACCTAAPGFASTSDSDIEQGLSNSRRGASHSFSSSSALSAATPRFQQNHRCTKLLIVAQEEEKFQSIIRKRAQKKRDETNVLPVDTDARIKPAQRTSPPLPRSSQAHSPYG